MRIWNIKMRIIKIEVKIFLKVDFSLKNILSMKVDFWCACTSAEHGFVFVWENIIKSCMFKSVCVPYLEYFSKKNQLSYLEYFFEKST